jgi:hypothetical protein
MNDDTKRHQVAIPPVAENQPAAPLPWEEIETGRYMPRRIRGSYLGRVLG